jgi:hypothetical protein
VYRRWIRYQLGGIAAVLAIIATTEPVYAQPIPPPDQPVRLTPAAAPNDPQLPPIEGLMEPPPVVPPRTA